MPFPTMNEDQLNQLINEVGSELDTFVASAQARLSKADEGKDSPPEKSPESSPAGDGGGDESSGPPSEGSDASAGGPPGADASASPSADPSAGGPPPDASASAGAPGQDPAAGGEDLETKLQALPDDQLRHLYMAAKQALFQRMASADPQASASAPPGAPPAGPPGPGMSPSPSPAAPPPAAPPMAAPSPSPAGPPAPMEPPPGPPMGKGEMKASPANGGGKTTAVKIGKNQGKSPEGEDLVKAEDSQKIDQLSKQVESLSKALEGTLQFLTQPMRKSVTQISQVQHLAKPGTTNDKPAATTLSKAEITEKLKSLDLKKTTAKDRDAVNGFYCGRVGVDKIAHLLGN